jgi:hypothetical protein
MFFIKQNESKNMVGIEKNPKFRFFVIDKAESRDKIVLSTYDNMLNSLAFIGVSKTETGNELISVLKEKYNIDASLEEVSKVDQKASIGFWLKNE